MTSGFGVDPTLDGNGAVVSGTTSTDIQNIWGGLYSPGIISGCAVSTSASAYTYAVTAGVVMVPTATGKNIAAPVPSSTVATDAPPATGSRTDIIYAQQRFPSIEGDSEVVVGVATVLPVRAVKLASYIVSAGATSTANATRTGSVDYSIPYSGNLGILYQQTDTWTGIHNQNSIRVGSGNITLPTDRLLRVNITTCLWADGAVGFDNSKYCEWFFKPEIDTVAQAYWTVPGLHGAAAIYNLEGYFNASAGSHVVSYTRGRRVGPGSARTYYGTLNGNFYPGTKFTVSDAGVSR